MDNLRLKRYKNKINYILDNMEDLPLIPENTLEKKGIFYSLQTSIESTVDLVAMLVKDLSIPVKDDYTNIKKIIDLRNIDPSLGEKLIKANGLRNILVDRYNSIEDEIILNSVSDIKDLLYQWLDIIEGCLIEIKNDE
ncbi:MAG: hypothetical protein BAJALOKI3v1_760003 [Promethearchaeota archaeon]|jgi:uncharacterized protein YutE (UPF0331/DUF86 family)|nr:MAG: hypothetical protein BAJALOKI3v1_760003 [Candidatus Lokiarchaeota archaeon]